MSTDVLHAPLLFADPPGKRYRAARDQAPTDQRKEPRNRKSEAWVFLAEENHEDHEGERQNGSSRRWLRRTWGAPPGHRRQRLRAIVGEGPSAPADTVPTNSNGDEHPLIPARPEQLQRVGRQARP